jgi:hypothetical protein
MCRLACIQLDSSIVRFAITVIRQNDSSFEFWKSDDGATGFTCPRCGGGIWEVVLAGDLAFQCRIGHKLSLSAMLGEHGANRREAVSAAARYLAEAAALNRRVAAWARTRDHGVAASRLESEATALDQRSADLLRIAASTLQRAIGDA